MTKDDYFLFHVLNGRNYDKTARVFRVSSASHYSEGNVFNRRPHDITSHITYSSIIIRWRCIPTCRSVFSLVHERSPRPFKISVEVDALQIMRYVIQHYYTGEIEIVDWARNNEVLCKIVNAKVIGNDKTYLARHIFMQNILYKIR